jgi:hypothetical protein
MLSSDVISKFDYLKIVEEKPFVYNVQMNREKKMNALNKQLWWYVLSHHALQCNCNISGWFSE